MNFYVTWTAGTIMASAGVASMFVFVRHPRWSKWLAAVQVIGGLVVVANEALRPGPLAMLGVWVLVLVAAVCNWRVARRAERRHERNMREALDVLGDLEKMHRERARMLADEAMKNPTLRGERRAGGGIGIWPVKEC